MDSIKNVTVGPNEKMVVQVNTDRYIKLVFKSCVIALREEGGVVYSVTEMTRGIVVDDEETVDPIAEMCACECAEYSPVRGGVVREDFDAVNAKHARKLGSGEVGRKLSSEFFDEDLAEFCALSVEEEHHRSSSPVWSYHWGDTPGYTQTMDECDVEEGYTQKEDELDDEHTQLMD